MYSIFNVLTSVPPGRWIRPQIVSLCSGLSELARANHLADVPILMERLAEAELKIRELTARVERLESERRHSSARNREPSNDSMESNTSFCSARQVIPLSNTNDHSAESNKANDDHLPKVNGQRMQNGNANGAMLPPPPAPTLDNFKFTSTPNPVFLSRGKLHQKASKSHGSKVMSDNSDKSPEEEEMDNFTKSKKQRIVPGDLIQQKKLLRKFSKAAGQMVKKNGSDVSMAAANQSIEEDDGSLNALMKNALKRKFANVEVNNTLNDSQISNDTTNAEFSL